jgi:methyl-accepting chemotaxis protein
MTTTTTTIVDDVSTAESEPPLVFHQLQIAATSIEQTELHRKAALLKLFCKIVLSIVPVCWVLQVISSMLSGRASPLASLVIGSIITATFIAWRLVERDTKNYRAASRTLVSVILITASITYYFFGGDSALLLIFLIPVGLAAALLNFTETVAVCLISMAYTATLYIGQHALNIYTPPLQIRGIGLMVLGLLMCGVILPLVSALITIPALSKARLLQKQNRELHSALALLRERQELSESVSRQVAELASELKRQAVQQEGATAQQNEALRLIQLSGENLTDINSQIAASATNISQRTADVLKSTQEVSLTAQTVVQSGVTGLAAVQQTIASNLRVNEQYERLLQTLSGLSKTSATIKTVIELLQSIGSQTHLLALNAAIEAAGAGAGTGIGATSGSRSRGENESENVAGSRFGVIAHEVRSLAERSQNAAKEVNTRLVQIEHDILAATTAVRQGQTASEEAVGVARQSGIIISQLAHVVTQNATQVQRIDTSLEEVNRQLEQIGGATHQQHAASEQVLASLHALEAVSSQTTAQSIQLSTTARSLEELSRRLQRSLSLTASQT